jgi:excisionase family DNA binding protein
MEHQSTENNVPKLLVSKRSAAESLGVSIRTIENFIARKDLPARKLGRRTLIPFAALRQFATRDHRSHEPVETNPKHSG